MAAEAYATAIAKLGFEAKSPPAASAAPRAARQIMDLVVPPDAPAFFVQAIESAKKSHRPVVIDFQAEWCVACLRLKRETLENGQVADLLRSVDLVYVDLDKYPSLGDAYGVAAIPDVVFADGAGRIVDRLQSFEGPADFVRRLRSVIDVQRNNNPEHSGTDHE